MCYGFALRDHNPHDTAKIKLPLPRFGSTSSLSLASLARAPSMPPSDTTSLFLLQAMSFGPAADFYRSGLGGEPSATLIMKKAGGGGDGGDVRGCDADDCGLDGAETGSLGDATACVTIVVDVAWDYTPSSSSSSSRDVIVCCAESGEPIASVLLGNEIGVDEAVEIFRTYCIENMCDIFSSL